MANISVGCTDSIHLVFKTWPINVIIYQMNYHNITIKYNIYLKTSNDILKRKKYGTLLFFCQQLGLDKKVIAN